MKYQVEEIELVNGLYPIQIVAVSDEEFEGKFGKFLVLTFRVPGNVLPEEGSADVDFTRPMSARVLPSTNLGRLVQAVNGGDYPTGKEIDTASLEGQWFEGLIEQEWDEQYVQTKIHTYAPLSPKLRKKVGKEVLAETAPFNF